LPEESESPTSTLSESNYIALPFIAAPQRAMIVSKIMNETIKLESVFTDYTKGDESRKASVAKALTAPDTNTWEVWKIQNGLPVDIVGIIYLTKIRYKQDAVAHYVFFDHDLLGKTPLLLAMMDWLFEEGETWGPLQRLTLEIPDFAYALAMHAQKRLGFGGKYRHKIGNKTLHVEGVKEKALMWRGELRDVLILGKHHERKDRSNRHEHPESTGTPAAGDESSK
jgi:hypothetical protein